ncbi:MAG: DUF4129 domain-containing protein, partial [Nitriliruptorales bacterium]
DEMERALAATGAARNPWEAPREYLGRIERGEPLPGPEPARLTGLYEAARFSHRPVDPATAEEARSTLDRLRSRLVVAEEEP